MSALSTVIDLFGVKYSVSWPFPIYERKKLLVGLKAGEGTRNPDCSSEVPRFSENADFCFSLYTTDSKCGAGNRQGVFLSSMCHSDGQPGEPSI